MACTVPLFVLSVAGNTSRLTHIKRRYQWKDDIANELNDSWVDEGSVLVALAVPLHGGYVID
jgi:hypothetical protein